MLGCWAIVAGSSVDGGVRHLSEFGEGSLECDGDPGDERGDGYEPEAGMTCERETSTGEARDIDVDATTADGATATGDNTHCGGTAGHSAPYSFLTR
jgi:hypothetical protein